MHHLFRHLFPSMFPLSVVAFSALLASSGCSDDIAAAQRLTSLIPATGGSIETPFGVSLEVPASALDAPLEIGVAIAENLAAEGYAAAPSFVAGDFVANVVLTPHGTTFDAPVTVRVPYTGDPSDYVLLRADDADDDTWEAVGPITFADGIATFQVTTFSAYTIAQVQAGGCPCFTGANVATFRAAGVAANARPEARISRSVSTGPQPGNERCARFPSYPGCEPAGTVRIHDNLIYWEGSWAAYLKVTATILPDGTLANGEQQCDTRAFSTVADYDRYFPWRPHTPGAWFTHSAPQQLTTAAQVETCHALLVRSTQGVVAAQVGFVASGLPTGESLVLDLDGTAVRLTESDTLAFAVSGAVGTAYTVTITSQPASATCAVSAGTLTGTLAESQLIEFTCGAATTEVACNNLDDDNDGAIDEDANGNIVDDDGDGIPNDCDPNPAVGCPSLTVADVRAAVAASGEACLVDASPAAADSFKDITGVLHELGDAADSIDAAFVARSAGADTPMTVLGCADRSDAHSAACIDAGRPVLAMQPLDSEAAFTACRDVAIYGCKR
jgi:hypothetical protein